MRAYRRERHDPVTTRNADHEDTPAIAKVVEAIADYHWHP